MTDRPATRFRENVTEITATLVTGIWLVGLFAGASWWLPALLVGYVVVVPIVALLFGDEEDRQEWWEWEDEDASEERAEEPDDATVADSGGGGDNREALETLRDRYARGDLTDAQFERKLERLLETDTLEHAEEWTRERRRGERAREEYDRDRDVEFET